MNLFGIYRKFVVFLWDLLYRYVGEECIWMEDSYFVRSDYCIVIEDLSCVDSDSDVKRLWFVLSSNCYDDRIKDFRLIEFSEVCWRFEGCCSSFEILFSLEFFCYVMLCLREFMKNWKNRRSDF